MYTYLKTNFPEIIIEPIKEENKYIWKLQFGYFHSMSLDICLTIKDDWWNINAIKKEMCGSNEEKPVVFQYTCDTEDDLGKFILDRVGRWLKQFSDYKKFQDEIHNDSAKRQYKVIIGVINEDKGS